MIAEPLRDLGQVVRILQVGVRERGEHVVIQRTERLRILDFEAVVALEVPPAAAATARARRGARKNQPASTRPRDAARAGPRAARCRPRGTPRRPRRAVDAYEPHAGGDALELIGEHRVQANVLARLDDERQRRKPRPQRLPAHSWPRGINPISVSSDLAVGQAAGPSASSGPRWRFLAPPSAGAGLKPGYGGSAQGRSSEGRQPQNRRSGTAGHTLR